LVQRLSQVAQTFSLSRWCYTALFYLVLPVVLLRLLWRARLASAYRRRVGERFGWFRSPARTGGIWVHAVSVGETIAAAPLIRELQRRFPDLPITVTTMTPTGSERVRALFGDSVFHVYAPYDLPDAISRFLRRVEPSLAIIMETELWPNTVHACARRRIPVLLANARLSARSARGYAQVGRLSAAMLRELAGVIAQNGEDGERFVALGLPRERLSVSGSIKFDIELDAALVAQAQMLKAAWQPDDRSIWIGASTHAGEDEILLHAHRQLRAVHAHALLILVPRHPERFDAVAALIEREGFSYCRRSSGAAVGSDTAVLLGDSMGELLCLYGCADVAVVGGSFVDRGGHNTLEPAAWGLPIVTGRSAFNFREIAELLAKVGASTVVDNADELARELIQLVNRPALRAQRGAAARRVVEENRGALQRLCERIEAELALSPK
jgi:3-deoxy-D-manno-octulosonic-acid transferase